MPILSYARIAILAAIILTIGGLFAWAKIERAAAQRYRAESAQWQAASEDNAAAIAALRADAERTQAALKAELAARQERIGKLEKIREKIIQVAPGDDGPVAPVLRDALDRLRQRGTDSLQGGAGDGSRGASGVPNARPTSGGQAIDSGPGHR